jgi:gliding motility associated protien GldN
MKKIVLILLTVCSSAIAFAQAGTPNGVNLNDPSTTGEILKAKDEWKPSLRPTGVIDKVPHINKVMPWSTIRENDVLYSKYVWREIDIRQRQNAAFRYPGDEESGGGTFIEILLYAIRKGKIQAFSDDRFTTPVSKEDVMQGIVGKVDTEYVTNPATGEVIMKIRQNDFKPEDVTRYRIKEQVIFDRNLGREVKRILAISAIMDKYDENGEYKGFSNIFWLSYPELRDHIVKYEVYNPETDVHRITWDDYFEKRFFASYIYKSSLNNYDDATIRDYKEGMDKLYESEKIKQDLFNKEHDLWVY